MHLSALFTYKIFVVELVIETRCSHLLFTKYLLRLIIKAYNFT